jgi:hypothetical protein
MKKLQVLSGSFLFLMILFFLITTQEVAGQQSGKSSTAIPEEINKIFVHSCTPCHTSKGGAMSKSMVNFDEWSKLSPEKQGTKAEKINKAVNSGFMPKKSAVEKKPDIALTKEQKETIRKWADSLKPPKK